MKNRALYLLFVLPLFIFSSCAKEEVEKTLDNHLIDNTWYISYYYDEKDETSNFSGYEFQFKENGVLIATKGGTSSSATWNVDNSSNKLIILFTGVTNYLEHLNDDWLLVERTNDYIKLKDDKSSESGELLHFSRK